MNQLSRFQRDCLIVIAGTTDPSGLDIKSELEDYYNDHVNHGRLYPNLDKLVSYGYIVKESADNRTNTYTITSEGINCIQSHREWVASYVPTVLQKTPESPETTQFV